VSKPDSISAPWPFKYPVWMDDAVCATTDPDSFFPEHGREHLHAKNTCARCPVATQCLAYALEHDERWGVWGGTNEADRQRLRKASA
jgi:WhiB family redox-sensing transcriptional regulator